MQVEAILQSKGSTVHTVPVHAQVRDAVNAGQLPGPRILASGSIVTPEGGHADVHGYRPDVMALLESPTACSGADACRRVVRKQIQAGADLIKIVATGGVLDDAATGVDPQFTDDCLELIFRHTGGVPRRINTLCDRLMLFGYLEERHRFDGTVVEAVVNELAGEVPGPAGGRPTAVVNPLRGVQEVRLEDLTLRVEALERRIKALEALLKKRSMWYALTGNR